MRQKAFGPRLGRHPLFSLFQPMAERSRSPAPGVGPLVERKEEVEIPNDMVLEAQTFKALQEQVQENTARLNSVDWMTTQTTSLLHRDQELQASKQLLLMGWPKIDDKEREREGDQANGQLLRTHEQVPGEHHTKNKERPGSVHHSGHVGQGS